jgi:hypothetical protein
MALRKAMYGNYYKNTKNIRIPAMELCMFILKQNGTG